MKVIIIMFQRKIIILNKNKSSYRKVERAMKECVKEYEQIKKLVEDTNGDIILKKKCYKINSTSK